MSTPESTISEQTNTTNTQASMDTNATDRESIKQAVQNQIEYYFSMKNLPNDSYLISLMNADHFVPLSILATFGKIQTLTQDISLLVEALENSTAVELSADKSSVRFRDTRKKTTIILHSVPSGTTEQNLLDLFAKGDFTVTLTSDINNCWFVECSDEETASSALQFVKQEKIDGQSIRARLRPIRNIYAALDSYKSFEYNAAPYAPTYTYGQWNPNGGAAVYWNPQTGAYEKGRSRKGKRDNRRDGNKKRTNKKNKGKETKKQAPTQLGPADFPPLPSTTGEVTGYSGEFKKYSHEQIAVAWKKLPVADLEGSNDAEFPLQSEVNEDLLISDAKPIQRSDLPSRIKPSGQQSNKQAKNKNSKPNAKSTKA